MYRAIAANKRNTVLIIGAFLLLLALVGFVATYLFGDGDWGIFIATIIGAGIYTFIQYFAASGQALALSGARQIQKADDPRLFRIVENLSITTGTPMPKVYIIADDAPNAFATGRDPEHAVVAATTGLLALMEDDELEGVMAHEMAHVQNYDIRVSTLVFGLVVAIGFISDMLLRLSFYGGNRNNSSNNPVGLVLGLAALIIAPLAAALVQAAISRQREYLADASGALTTRHPDALARALGKLAMNGRPMRRQNSSMAHMWIADPKKPSMAEKLFSTHPPIVDRVRRLTQIGSSF